MIKNLNVLTGPAGSGKTTYIVERIGKQLKDGKRVFYIVPEPSAVIAERRVSLYAKENGIPTANLDILSFKRLCNEYRRIYGGIAGSVPTKSLKALIMWRAFYNCADSLRFYSVMKSNSPAFIPTLLRQADEFNRYGVTPADLERAANGLAEGGLKDKTLDLALIFSNYNALLRENDVYTDDVSELADGMRKNRFFDGSCVYLDGFSGFTGAEYRIIDEMIRSSDEISIALCFEKGRGELFSNVKGDEKSVYSRLKSLCAKNGQTVAVTETEFARQGGYYSDDISYMEENLCREDFNGVFDAEKYEKKTDFVALANPYEEAEYVACDILRQIREENKSPRDFSVITANAEYLSLVCSSLEKHGIPVHRSIKTPLAETPLFRFIISALKVNENGWEREEIVSLIKTGFLKNITAEETDLLDDYLKTWGLKGKKIWGEKWEFNPLGFTEKTDKNGKEIASVLEKLNKTREKVYDALSGFCDLIGKNTVGEILSALYEFLTNLGIPNTADADEVRAFNALIDCIEALNTSVGDYTPCSTAGFLDLFTLSVTGASIGSIPEYFDEVCAVVFGNVYGRTGITYIVGCANGLLPAMPSENGLFTDSDKLVLEGSDVILSPTVERMITENNYNFYRAVCTGKERLVFTRPLSGNDGEKYIESEQYKAILSLLDGKETENVPDGFWVQDKVSAKECAGLYRGTPLGDACSDGREPGVPLVCENESLSAETAKKVFGEEKDLSLSPSRIERFSKCPFMDACNSILRLRKKLISTEAGLSLRPNEKGTLTHYILENFFKQEKVAKKLDSGNYSFDENEISDDVNGFIEKYKENVLGKSGINYLDAKSLHNLDVFKNQSVLLIEAMLKHLEETNFVPKFFEYKISKKDGKDGKPLEIEIDGGRKILLGGSVDRIDTYEKDGEVYFRVIDYKASKKNLNSGNVDEYIEDGISLQMLIYLFALENDVEGKLLSGKTGHATGVVYVPTNATPEANNYKESERDEIVSNVKEAIKLAGIFNQAYEDDYESAMKRTRGTPLSVDEEKFNSLKDKLEETVKAKAQAILSGEASASPISAERTGNNESPCEKCDFKTICRRMNVKEEE